MSIGDTDFGVQVSIGFLGRLLTTIVAFLGSIVLARVLGPDGYGTFYLLMAFVLFLDNPVTGWATACRKRLTETDFPSGEAVGSMLLAIVSSSVLVFLIVGAMSGFITSITSKQNAWLYLGVLFVSVVSFRTSLELLNATKRFGAGTWAEASRDTVRVVIQVMLVVGGLGVAGMVTGMAAANLIIAPAILILIGIMPSVPTRSSLSNIWTFARSSIPSGVVGTAQGRMDILLLGFVTGTKVVGMYEIALKMTIPAMFIAGIAQNGLMGRISNLKSRGEPFDRDVQNNLAYASLVGIPLFFGVAVLAEPVVVTIYGNKFSGTGPFLIGLAFFRLLRTQKVILVSTINGLNSPDINLKISTIVFSINLILGVSLLLAIGPLGVVVATVGSELLGYALRAYAVRGMIPNLSLFPRALFDQVFSGGVMAVFVYIGRQMVPLAYWPNVVALVGLGGMIYFITLLLVSHPFRSTVLAIAADAGLY